MESFTESSGNSASQNNPPFSPFDTLENLNFQAQKLFNILDELPDCNPGQKQVIQVVRKGISNLVNGWDPPPKVEVPSLRLDKLKVASPNRSKTDSFHKDKKYQKLESKYQQRIQILDNDVDEIIFHLKSKYKPAAPIGNILPDLFSKQQLEHEGKIALGQSRRETSEVIIPKFEGEKFDQIMPQSLDTSGPPSQLNGSELVLYEKLDNLRQKLKKYKHVDLGGDTNQSLDQAFCGSLPISMKSVSKSGSMAFQSMLKSIRQNTQKLTLNLSPSLEHTLGFTKKEVDVQEVQGIFDQEILSLDQKQNLLMTLIQNGNQSGRDVCLDDLLNISEQASIKPVDRTQSGSLTFKPEQSRFELSIPIQDISLKESMITPVEQSYFDPFGESPPDISLSFIHSENSEDQKRVNPLLKRPKQSDDSIIFPPLNISSEQTSVKGSQKLPKIIPSKPTSEPPSNRFFKLRGRSLQPVQPCPAPIEVKGSPITINNIRMRRFQNIKRNPFQPSPQKPFRLR